MEAGADWWPGLDTDESQLSVNEFLEALEDSCDMKEVDHDDQLSPEEWLSLLRLVAIILG